MKLGPYLEAHDIEPSHFADELGVAGETVRRYIAGTRVPESKHLRRIAELTRGKVLPNDWFDLSVLAEPTGQGAGVSAGGRRR